MTLVPEAATQVYAARRTRWDRLDDGQRRDVQREIYHFQRAQKTASPPTPTRAAAACCCWTAARSTARPTGPKARPITGATWAPTRRANWPAYDAVLILESAAALGSHLYDGDASNAVRFEDAAGALASGRVLNQSGSAIRGGA